MVTWRGIRKGSLAVLVAALVFGARPERANALVCNHICLLQCPATYEQEQQICQSQGCAGSGSICETWGEICQGPQLECVLI